MECITFDCTTITPMFLAGADGRTPELRAPTIKGMMRFWWRAMAANDNKEVMLAKEANIWGSCKENNGRSKVIVSIIDPSLRDGEKTTNQMLPYKHSASMPAVSMGVKFTINIASKIPELLDVGKQALETALLLGGFGKRSRRGFGSVQCSHWEFTSPDNVLRCIMALLGTPFHLSGNKIKRADIPAAKYPYIKEITIGNSHANSNDILLKIGKATHDCANNALGFASGGRMASPVYISVVKIGDQYHPIITKMNSVFPPTMEINNYDIIQNKFIGVL